MALLQRSKIIVPTESVVDKGTRSFVEWGDDIEAQYAPGGILAEVSNESKPNV